MTHCISFQRTQCSMLVVVRITTLLLLSLLFVPPMWAQAPEHVDGSFTVVVIPDTQVYAWKYPETYRAQMRWVAENAEKYNIAYMVHLGDVTQHNTPEQWIVARDAHKLLGRAVRYAMSTGNHDIGVQGKMDSRDSFLSTYFPVADFKTWFSYGGIYDKEPEKIDNNYHLFSAGGEKWLVLALEFAPRDDVLRWANEVVSSHQDRKVIMITHAYMRPNNERYDRTLTKERHFDRYASHLAGGVNDGGDMWRKLIKLHPNFRIVISGHVGITGKLTSTGDAGNEVQQMVVDYQEEPEGGGGFLRLLTFLPDGETVRVRDYSPVYDRTIAEADRSFDFSVMPLGIKQLTKGQ